jgi:alkanesulfonate monooxygenase SsuD/methylene tetrahydromethanopterin reductase-like flavin-dependent oxidoreductase (luciferase family)
VNVKLDVLYEVDAPKPWGRPHPYGQRDAERRAYREAVEQIRLADKVGFNTIWAVEHHFREGRSHCPAPEVLLGHLAGVTEQIGLGFGVTLTPFAFTPPQRIAEKVAAVDLLSQGRVQWGTGRSTPMEQTAFHVDREKSRDDWAEAIKIVCGMWRDEYFEYEWSPRSHGRTRTRRAGWRRRRRARQRWQGPTGSACCRSRSCSRWRRWPLR